MPDGHSLDVPVVEAATALFKKHNLSQAAAQELVDFYSEHGVKTAASARQAVKDMRAEWLSEVRNDPDFKSEFGVDGKVKPDSKLLTGVSRMLSSLGDAKLANEFRAAMDFTGAGDHPAFIKVMSKLADHFAEGAPVRGNGPSRFGQPASQQERRSAAHDIYPNLP